MRKIVFMLLVFSGVIGAATQGRAQGVLFFENNIVRSPVTFASGINAGQRVFAPANTYTFGLYVGPLGSTSFSQLTLIDTVGNLNAANGSFPTAGLYNGELVSGQGNAGAANGFAGLIGATTYADEVAVWPTADGPDYLSALQNNDGTLDFGLSPIGFITPTFIPTPPPSVGANSPQQAGQIPGFSIAPVPIPDNYPSWFLMILALGSLAAVAPIVKQKASLGASVVK
jgi:hypothetical protein